MPPILVRAAGPTADTLTLDIAERQVLDLVDMEDDTFQYWYHVLFYRVGARACGSRSAMAAPAIGSGK